jgi:serine/threonine protein kinase
VFSHNNSRFIHPLYSTPQQDYTDKADIWSIGVVTYVLLCGYPPFNAGTESLTYNILTEDGANVKFPSPAWDSITPDAIAFIKRLLDKDPDRRPSAKDALDDEWLSSEHVHPSSKKENWHGTFLNVFSPEAQAVPIENSVIHVEKSKQDSYHRMLHALKHWKGQQNNNNDSLRNKNISNSLNNKNNINNSNSSSRRNNNNNNGHNRNNSRDSDFNIRNLFRKKSTSDDL